MHAHGSREDGSKFRCDIAAERVSIHDKRCVRMHCLAETAAAAAAGSTPFGRRLASNGKQPPAEEYAHRASGPVRRAMDAPCAVMIQLLYVRHSCSI